MDKRKLKALRAARGETQTQFASHFSVAQNTISKWETMGVPRKQVALRARILKVFNKLLAETETA